MYNGKSIEVATQIDVGVHKAITRGTYIASIILVAVGVLGFVACLIPMALLDAMDRYFIVLYVFIIVAILGAVLYFRLRSAYRSTAGRGSYMQTFSFFADGVSVTVYIPGGPQQPLPKVYYKRAKKARLAGKKGRYIVFNSNHIMYPVDTANLTEAEKNTIMKLLGRKVTGETLELVPGGEDVPAGSPYAAAGTGAAGYAPGAGYPDDDIFDLGPKKEDDIFTLGDSPATGSGTDAGTGNATGTGMETGIQSTDSRSTLSADPDSIFTDHYWDTPDEDTEDTYTGEDSGMDSGEDSGEDSGMDSGEDSGEDSGKDSGEGSGKDSGKGSGTETDGNATGTDTDT